MRLLLMSIFLSVFFVGCIWDWKPRQPTSYKVLGSIPVYDANPALKKVETEPPRQVTNAGKIYVYKNFLLQCEVGEGIHVIDNTEPSKAKRVAFIKAKGANEISVKGNFLYTNSYKDLLVIDISNIDAAKEVKRIPAAFSVNGYLPTPPESGYYECVDLTKGVVTSWRRDSINYSGCYKQ